MNVKQAQTVMQFNLPSIINWLPKVSNFQLMKKHIRHLHKINNGERNNAPKNK